LEVVFGHVGRELKSEQGASLVSLTGVLAGVWSSVPIAERKAAVWAPGWELKQVYSALAERGVAEAGSLSSSDLALLTSHFVMLGLRKLDFFRAVSKRVYSELALVPMKDLAQVLRNFAELGVSDPRLFVKAAQRLETEPRNLEPETLVNLAVALALPSARHRVVGEFGVEKGQQTPISHKESALLVDLARSALKSNAQLEPQAVCDLLAALASRGVSSRALVLEVVSQGPEIFRRFDRSQLLSFAESCADLGARYSDVRHQPFLRALHTTLGADGESFSQVEVVRFFRAASRLRMKISGRGESLYQDPLLGPFERVASRVLELRDVLGAAQLATLTVSMQRCAFCPREVLQSLQPRVLEVSSNATDMELAGIVFVYSRSTPIPHAFLSELMSAALKRPWDDIGAFGSFAASCAHLGLKDPELFKMFPQIVLQRPVDACEPRLVARLTSAYVKLGESVERSGAMTSYFDPYFFEGLLERISPARSELPSKDLSNLARAVAECFEKTTSVGIVDDVVARRAQSVRVVKGIAEAVAYRLGQSAPESMHPEDWEVSCQSIAVVTRALTMLGLTDPAVLKSFSEATTTSVQSFKMEELSKIAAGMARLRYRNVRLFESISNEAVDRLEVALQDGRFKAQDACMLVWANANIHVPHERLCTVAVGLLLRYPDRWELRDRVQLAWSLAVLKPELVGHVVSRRDLESINDPIRWRQTYHALLAGGEISHQEHFDMLDSLGRLPDAVASSRFEDEVFQELIWSVGLQEDQIKRHAFIAAIPVDMVVNDVIVECDGDMWHYSEGPDGGVLMGSDCLQDRILNDMAGYRVVHIRNEEFHANRRQALAPLRRALDATD
jgi:very-short-patch-repair endonuclease